MKAGDAQLRLRYARHVTARLSRPDPALVEAFAAVPRERFFGDGPWLTVTPLGTERTADANPAHLYADVAIASDPLRGVDNGEPSLHALAIDSLGLAPGQVVAHIGCGVGYYTAILAHIVGGGGRIEASESDRHLAARAEQALVDWPHAVVRGSAVGDAPLPPCDAVYVETATTGPREAWLDAVREGGHIVFPLTDAFGRGVLARLTRRGDAFAVQPLARVTFVPPVLPRRGEVGVRLAHVFAAGRLMSVRTLHRGAPSLKDAAMVVGDGWWLSAVPLDL